MNELANYIDTHLHRRPDARVKLIDLGKRFRLTLDARTKPLWPRWRVLATLRQEYTIGTDSDGVVCIAGLAWEPAPRWVANSQGRLQLQTSR